MVENVDLLTLALELYRLPPSDFTSARNAHAKQALAAGGRSLADDLRQLPKPSAAAWALNQLGGESGSTVVTDFEQLGNQLRRAQANADRTELDQLVRQRRTLVKQTINAIQKRAVEAGIRLSAGAVTEIEQSLQAALADGEAQTAVFSGRLVRSVQSDGLEPVDLENAVAGPVLARARSSKRSSPKRASVSANKQKAVDARNKAREAILDRTRQAAQVSDAELDSARRDRALLDEDRKQLDVDVKDLQEQFDQLERRRAELDLRAARVDRQIEKAEAKSRKAHADEDRAANRG
jgi:hypothetical protein